MRPRHIALALLVVLAAALLTACGEKKETLGDETAIHGPGVRATAPPWPAEHAKLKQRIAQLDLPPVGKETFHIHSLMHVYVDGELVQLPPDIGVDRSQKLYAALHTHDPTGIVHMESDKPFKSTIGDFFVIWGLKFGNKSLGSLRNKGEEQVRVLVNGKTVTDPVNYVMRDNDNIVVAYGTADSFPKEPDDRALETVSKKGGGTCTKGGGKGNGTSCVDPDAQGGEDKPSRSRRAE